MADTSPAPSAFSAPSRCDALRDPSTLNLAVSIFILVGMLVSYLPQHIRIIARRTAEGISPFFVLLGVTSATAGLANILTLPQSRQDVACCHELDKLHCLAGLLGIAQLGVQWACFVLILVLFLVFFRYAPDDVQQAEADGVVDDETEALASPPWQTAFAVAVVCVVHGLLVIVVTAVLAAVAPERLAAWANVLGLSAAALAAVQYLPQIYTTYRLKHVGSLSIPMMLMQTPGGLLFAGSLFMRLGWAGWSSWGIFLLTACMQGVLLVMGIYFELNKAHAQDDVPTTSSEPSSDANANNTPSSTDRKPSRLQRMLSYRSARDDGTPGRYSAHPEHYGSTPDEISDIIDRQDGDAATETQPLLRPGGIGNPRRGRYS